MKRFGLTLLELLVVLLILSILTVVAVQSTDILVDQGRFDGTQQSLKGVEEAILGPKGQRQADGTLMISGFVADMGRLPLSIGGNDMVRLQELWNVGLYTPAQTYALKSPTSVSSGGALAEVNDLLIGSGFRGPYLNLPIGAGNQLRDGWGNAFVVAVVPASGPTQSISIQSNGGDAPPYNGASPIKTISRLDAFAQTVSGIVKEKTNQGGMVVFQGSSLARVYLLEPDGLGGVKARFTLTNLSGEFVFSPVNSDDLGISTGPRIIRVVKTYTHPTDPSMPFTARDTLNVVVTPGGLGNLTLNLVPPDPYNQVTPEQPMAPETPEP